MGDSCEILVAHFQFTTKGHRRLVHKSLKRADMDAPPGGGMWCCGVDPTPLQITFYRGFSNSCARFHCPMDSGIMNQSTVCIIEQWLLPHCRAVFALMQAQSYVVHLQEYMLPSPFCCSHRIVIYNNHELVATRCITYLNIDSFFSRLIENSACHIERVPSDPSFLVHI